MPERFWSLLNSRLLSEHRVFKIHADRYRVEPGGLEMDFYCIESVDWINIIPVTAEGDVVFVRQYRHGVRAVTLEIPGGMVDPGEDPQTAAVRELREETGYRATNVKSLGNVWPNPAIQNNRCHMYLAENVVLEGEIECDPGERIEVVTHPLKDVPRLIREGEIRHALVIVAFSLMGVTAASD